MTTPSPNFSIQFPVPTGTSASLAVPPPPPGPAANFLSVQAQTPDTRKMLVAKDLLAPEDQEKARAFAAQLYPQMLANTQILMDYGKDAVAGMNALIDQLLREVKPVEVPELSSLMKDLSQNMRGMQRKYDVTDPHVRERIEKQVNGVRNLFGQVRSIIDILMEDAMSVEQQIDRVKSQLAGKEQQMIKNVHLYDALYSENESEVMRVISAIAVMELVRDLAREEAQSVVVDDNNPADRAKSERKRLLAEFISNLEIKITEYKNRLFVGWTTSPQITNMRTLDVGLAQKLDLLLNLTIPVMKGTILQWRMLIQSMQGAQMATIVAEAANEWLTAYTKAGAQAVPLIASAVQTPTLSPQTIGAMADAIASQADSIVEAYEKGKQDRLEVNNAIVDAQRTIQASTNRVSDEVVNKLVEKASERLSIQ